LNIDHPSLGAVLSLSCGLVGFEAAGLVIDSPDFASRAKEHSNATRVAPKRSEMQSILPVLI